MLRNDGEYKFYIIKHKYKKKGEWAGSGDCRQWLSRKDITYDEQIKIFEKHDKTLTPFTACGDCWQQTGVSGSYDKKDALKILTIISDLNPEHTFGVFSVTVKQKTSMVAQMTCEGD